jgi:NADH-quinone oxidoreductase subunit N
MNPSNPAVSAAITPESLTRLLPLIILTVGMVVIVLVIAFRRSHPLTAGLAFVTQALAIVAVPLATSQGSGTVTPLLIMDGYASFIIGLILAASVAVTLLAYGYLKIRPERREEFYVLLLSAVLGSCVLAASNHFVALFLGLEVLSLSLYALIGYAYDSPISIEAGVKYLILAGASSAFLLFGMALVYATVGNMEFTGIATAAERLAVGSGSAAQAGATDGISPAMLIAGLVLMLVGIGYKLALVPFHMWTPDVYEGSPAPVTAFVATISKGSMFAVLVRFFSPLLSGQGNPQSFPNAMQSSLFVVFVVIAIATMLVGNLLALLQSNLKRILAYSSIANLGYLLVAFLAGGANGVSSSTFYLVSYFVTILAAFGVVTVLSSGSRDAGWLDEYRGLMWSRPWLAAILAAAMFSLAGLPLTVGFIGKFYVVLAGVGSAIGPAASAAAALRLLVIILVISSAIGLYYYLRVVVMMYNRPAPENESTTPAPAMTPASGLVLAGLLLLVIWLGVYPTPLLDLIQSMVQGLY